jgi:hypothetical protein
MAIHVLKPNLMKLQEASSKKEDDSTIEERVTRIKADEYLEAWKKLKVKHGMNDNVYELSESTQERENHLKIELFNQFGEDVDDIFKAFRHYGLDPNVTEEDR